MNKSSKLSRRGLFAGATGVGVAAVAVSLLPALNGREESGAQRKAAPSKGGGYSLTEHVKQYYKSTSI